MDGKARIRHVPGDAREVFGSGAEGERAAARLASRQHGVITRQQLLSIGLSGDQIDKRIKAGWLVAMHRGVYLIGAVVPPHAHEMAAVLACGNGSVLSHRSAAVLWLLLPPPRQPQVPEVTVPCRNPGRRRGIRIHRVGALDPAEIRTRSGIPVTSPARTLLDIAANLPAAEYERAVAEALARRLSTRRELSSVLARNGGRPGAPALRRMLNDAPRLTRSKAERRFLALIRSARLPQPETNIRVGRFEIDFLWREQRLVVEVDGFAFHSSRVAFEQDRQRDAELQAAGFRVIRVTWRQIVEQPEATIALLAQALATLTPASPRGRGGAP